MVDQNDIKVGEKIILEERYGRNVEKKFWERFDEKTAGSCIEKGKIRKPLDKDTLKECRRCRNQMILFWSRDDTDKEINEWICPDKNCGMYYVDYYDYGS